MHINWILACVYKIDRIDWRGEEAERGLVREKEGNGGYKLKFSVEGEKMSAEKGLNVTEGATVSYISCSLNACCYFMINYTVVSK